MKMRFYRCRYERAAKSRTLAQIELLVDNFQAFPCAVSASSKNAIVSTTEKNSDAAVCRPYGRYLVRALESDFDQYDPQEIEAVLRDIRKLERGEIQIAHGGGCAFNHTLTSTHVSFEHSIFNECEVWPIWSCPLAHYKAALEGWRTFLNMPDDINTELIIELPDVAN